VTRGIAAVLACGMLVGLAVLAPRPSPAATPGEVPMAPPPPRVAPGTPARVPLGPPRRPQLSNAEADAFAMSRVLGLAGPLTAPHADPWRPLDDAALASGRTPDTVHYRVDPAATDGRRVFATVQGAVEQAHRDALDGRHAGVPRVVIAIAPGLYEEVVVVPASPVPITLWGDGDGPDAVRLQATLYSRMPGTRYAERLAPVLAPARHPDIRAPHEACRQREFIGTDCAVVLRVRNSGFQLHRITVANRYGQDQPGNLHQALALSVDGADRVHLERVHLYGHQDTLFLRNGVGPDGPRIARVFVHRSLVAGDVDFIFGDAVAFVLRSEIRWVGGLRGARSGFVAAPSTDIAQPYGMVFDRCRFTSDGLGLAARRQVHLARQWFYGARCSPYGAGGDACRPEPSPARDAADTRTVVPAAALRAVGKVVVLRSRLGRHIHPAEPWAPWNRAPDSPAYRPAQYGAADFWRHLAEAGHDTADWRWPGAAPPAAGAQSLPWLAEYRNEVEPERPEEADNAR
jgi:pectin methylesterase-like acyl-CoA thioesterase